MRHVDETKEQLLICLVVAHEKKVATDICSDVSIQCDSLEEVQSLRMKLYRWPKWLDRSLTKFYATEDHAAIKNAFSKFALKVDKKTNILTVTTKINTNKNLHKVVDSMYNNTYRFEDLRFRSIKEK